MATAALRGDRWDFTPQELRPLRAASSDLHRGPPFDFTKKVV